jgi:hypothetical protein
MFLTALGETAPDLRIVSPEWLRLRFIMAGLERLLGMLERDPSELEIDAVALDQAIRDVEADGGEP